MSQILKKNRFMYDMQNIINQKKDFIDKCGQFNSLVQRFIQILNNMFPSRVTDFDAFNILFKTVVSKDVSYPLKHFYELSKTFQTQIENKDEEYFLQYSTEGLFDTIHIKRLYSDSLPTEKETIWSLVQQLSKFANTVMDKK